MIYVKEDDKGNLFVIQNEEQGAGDFLIRTRNESYNVRTNKTYSSGLILAIRAVAGLTMEPIISARVDQGIDE